MYMYKYTNMQIYKHTHIYICVYTCIHTYIHIYRYMHTYTHMHKHIYIKECTRVLVLLLACPRRIWEGKLRASFMKDQGKWLGKGSARLGLGG